MSGFKTYQDIKSNIKLLDYLYATGYVLDVKKSSATWFVLKNNTGDKILYHTKKELYHNADINLDRGDIINFVANRASGVVNPDKSKEAIYNAVQFIKSYDFTEQQEHIATQQKKADKKILLAEISKTEFNCKPITDYSYFIYERFLSKKTITDPLFTNRIYNSFYRMPSNGHIITNFAFGKYKNDELVGLEVRNKKLKHVSGNHDAIFHSNHKQFESIDYVFIAESAINVLSYHELFNANEKLKNKNSVYLSTSGNIYQNKLQEINNLIEDLPIKAHTKYVSITDNDTAGNYYDHLLFANFIKTLKAIDVQFSNNEFFYIYDFKQLTSETKTAIKTAIEQFNAEKTTSNQTNHGNFAVLKETDRQFILNIPITITFDSPLMKAIKSALKSDLLLIPHKAKLSNYDKTQILKRNESLPVITDWNDYLKFKKKAHIK